MRDRLNANPAVAAAIGAGVIATSGTLTKLSNESPATIALWRNLWALPFLFIALKVESKTQGTMNAREKFFAAGAGLMFTLDLISWHYSIRYIGAGMATVLGNLSSVVVAAIAWIFLKERPNSRFFIALPLVLGGVALTTGVFGGQTWGIDPKLGAIFGLVCSFCYGIFLLLFRESAKDLRIASPLFIATLFSALGTLILGGFVDKDFHLFPSFHSQLFLFLLAVLCQVLGWLVISIALPRLPAALTALILLLQPLVGVGISSVVLGERPTLPQLLGGGIILFGVVFAVRASDKNR
jgi:drug/metabolite transporter (DMT)-like permease